jgi:hypothetical protein
MEMIGGGVSVARVSLRGGPIVMVVDELAAPAGDR